MHTESLFPKSEADIEKEYKQRIFLTTLKEGKTPKRKCLFKNIFYLSNLYKYLKMIQSVSVLDNSPYDRRYEIMTNYSHASFKKVTESEELINNLKRYLSNNFRLEITSYHTVRYCFYIYFKHDKIRWDLIDHDLKEKHPDNIWIKPNGFVYVKNYGKLFK